MADVIEQNEVVTETNEQPQTQQLDDRMQALQSAIWDDKPMPATATQQQTSQTQPTEQPKQQEQQPEPKKEDDIVFDENDYIKKTFGHDSVDALKKEREELLKLKEQKPEIKFENEISDKVFKALQAGKTDEVADILIQQKRLEKLTSAEVTKDNAEEIIKMSLQLKNPALTKDEIDFEYQQQFSIPKEPKQPVQRGIETDEDFEERMEEWKELHSDWERVKSNLDTRLSIAAKMAKPELEAAKANIVFPEYGQQQSQQGPTQEELEKFKKLQEEFVQSSDAALKSFNGFTASVKDKDVDYTVEYSLSSEEKAKVNSIINQFVKDGFNPNAILAERWVNEDGSLNVNNVIKDVSRIYIGDSAEAKMVNDAAGQRLAHYLKDKKNINVTSDNSGQFNPTTPQTESERLAEKFWN
ncbi:MAG TPA: hypothetical protein PKV73_01125 [Agriterribacter sp.]|nr:hypothetical protein [Agriterribacter sp.]